MHDRNLRLFLQSQAGINEVSGIAKARVDLPGEYTGNAIVMGQHTLARSSVLIVKKQSHQAVRYYDPAHHGQKTIMGTVQVAQDELPIAREVVEEENNLQGFTLRERADVMNVFADIGIVVEDDNILAEDEETDPADSASNQELNGSNVIDPAALYAELADKTTKNFGISKQELASFNLTARQVKALYTEVTGKQPGTTSAGKLKRRIRDAASESYSNYTRVMMALKKVVNLP